MIYSLLFNSYENEAYFPPPSLVIYNYRIYNRIPDKVGTIQLLGFSMTTFIKYIVISLNALLVLMLLSSLLPTLWSQPSFLSVLLLLLLIAPFATTILYAVTVRNTLFWLCLLGANILTAIPLVGFTFFLASLAGGYSGSLAITMIELLIFIGAIIFVNIIYLLWNRPKKVSPSTPSQSSIDST